MHIYGWPGYVDQAGPTLRAPPVSASSSEIKMCTYPNFENYIRVCVHVCHTCVCGHTPVLTEVREQLQGLSCLFAPYESQDGTQAVSLCTKIIYLLCHLENVESGLLMLTVAVLAQTEQHMTLLKD